MLLGFRPDPDLNDEVNLNEKVKSADERLKSMQRFREEFREFKALLETAFDELHSTVIAKISLPGFSIGPHSDYPRRSSIDSGFPHFSRFGFYNQAAPRDYVGVVRPTGLLELFSGRFDVVENPLPALDKLIHYLRTHEIGSKVQDVNHEGESFLVEYTVNQIVGGAVERYLHVHGIDTPIDKKRRAAILKPLMLGVIQQTRHLSLMVPIALTHFDCERYRLSDSAYLVRIPKRFQLSRARMHSHGSGASEQVVHAATHAFVSSGWTLDVDEVGEVSRSLSSASQNALDAVDIFLGALRVATGVKTGYAQLLWVPRRWALDYYCDLPPVYGRMVRQYPSDFDNYGWTRGGARISLKEMDSVKRVYEQMNNNDSEAVRLATRRLSSCLTRDDPSDAVLDGTIGLELLLGDDENQSLSYKLRLRCAALSWLDDSTEPAAEIAKKVKQIYSARSAIVHGKKSKPSKKAVDQDDARGEDERQLAAQLLRFVLQVLLAHPKYLEPSQIDSDLILRGKDV